MIVEIDDLAMAAVVGCEAVDRRVGKALLEGDEAVGVGAAEAVYRLIFIADHADVAVHFRQSEDDLLLGEVGVLVLVHQQMVNLRSPTVGQAIVSQKDESLRLQAAEINRVQRSQQLLVAPVAPAQSLQ